MHIYIYTYSLKKIEKSMPVAVVHLLGGRFELSNRWITRKKYVYDKDRQYEDQTITRICIWKTVCVGQDYLVTFTLHIERKWSC